ncbi:MAG: hypothetical protein AB7S75_19410 [Desulfococcaceae bacterium]
MMKMKLKKFFKTIKKYHDNSKQHHTHNIIPAKYPEKIIRGEITVSIFPEIMVILSMTAIIALVIVLLT